MRKIKTICAVSLVSLLFLTSCVHHTPFVQEHYFEAMGDEGEVVMTFSVEDASRIIDMSDAETGIFSALLKRVDRVSFALYNQSKSEDTSLSDYSFYGGAEGNIPSFLTNTSLLYSKEWDKIEEEENHYYRNDYLGLDVYSPKSGLLLFASDEYMKAYNDTYKERTKKIESGLANRMADGLFGVYINSPQTMIDIGIEIPQAVLSKTLSIMLVFEEDDEQNIVLNGEITMESDKLAKSLSILLKSSYISTKRRNREPLGDLTGLFTLDENKVSIANMLMNDQQIESITGLFSPLTTLAAGER